jgi:Ca2+-binding EF-hand superfamily protein
MKHIGTKLSIVLATSLIGSSAFALKVKPPEDEPTFRQRVLAAHDADKNGRLSHAELEAFKAARKQQVAARKAQSLQTYDVNRDGKLDDTEKAKRKSDNQARLLKDFDANKNGTLEPAERKVIIARHKMAKVAKRFTLMVLRFDDNRDSKLQAKELPGKSGLKAKRFRKMDRNKDGAIERSEFVTAHAKQAKAKPAKAKKGQKGARPKLNKQLKTKQAL